MTVQTDEITPADKKLYALRDVTGTVASIPLIVASILSKKLAEGASTLVFDVKCGSGAFMKTREEAEALAEALVAGAKAAGRKAAALVTDMNAPLGRAVGNFNEVAEAIDILRSPASFVSRPDVALSVELAALMVSLAREMPIDEARQICRERLEDGSAYARFAAMVEAHGGSIEAFDALRAKPRAKFSLQAMRSGVVSEIDAEKVARVAFMLGAGRSKASDVIDPFAGVTLAVGIGERVSIGTPLATLEKSGGVDALEVAAAELLKAFKIAPSASPAATLILSAAS